MNEFKLDNQGNLIMDYTEEQLAFFGTCSPTSFPTKKDVQESLRVFTTIKAAPSQCWFNSRKAIRRLDDYADASYVEGWALFFKGLAIEHGWLVKDNKIIDPTLPSDGGLYFPGLEFKGRAGIEEFLQTPEGKKVKRSPFFYAFGWGGMQSPSFRRAWDQCKAAMV